MVSKFVTRNYAIWIKTIGLINFPILLCFLLNLVEPLETYNFIPSTNISFGSVGRYNTNFLEPSSLVTELAPFTINSSLYMDFIFFLKFSFEVTIFITARLVCIWSLSSQIILMTWVLLWLRSGLLVIFGLHLLYHSCFTFDLLLSISLQYPIIFCIMALSVIIICTPYISVKTFCIWI